MDLNEDPFDGCEFEITENTCYFGSCDEHNASPNAVCGGWPNLMCNAETSCCECQHLIDYAAIATTIPVLGCGMAGTVTECLTGQHMIAGVCVCDNPFMTFSQDGICFCHDDTPDCFNWVECPPNQHLNGNGECECMNPLEELLATGECFCPTGIITQDGVCQCQNPNMIISEDGICFCPSGTDCDVVVECMMDQFFNADGRCQCNNPLEMLSTAGDCYCPNGECCPPDAHRDELGFCMCNNPLMFVQDGICFCPAGSTCDTTQCSSNQQLLEDGTCGCYNPLMTMSQDGFCFCHDDTPDCFNWVECPPTQQVVAPGICGCYNPLMTISQDGMCFCHDDTPECFNWVECPPNQHFNGNGECQCNNPLEELMATGECYCPTGNISPMGWCECQNPNMIVSIDGICYCPSETDCYTVGECTLDQWLNEFGLCICNNPMEMLSTAGDCYCPTGECCPPDAHRDEVGFCMCNNPNMIVSTDGVCYCPTGIDCDVVVECNHDQFFNTAEGRCQCNNPMDMLSTDGHCYCPNDECCPPDAHRDEIGFCMCNNPNMMMTDGVCYCPTGIDCDIVVECLLDQFFNTEDGMCQCNNPMEMLSTAGDCYCPSGECCPPDAHRDEVGYCHCNNPNMIVSIDGVCNCPAGTTNCENSPNNCPPGMTYNDNEGCVCDHPHYSEFVDATGSYNCVCHEDVSVFQLFNSNGECICPLTHAFNFETNKCDQVIVTLPGQLECEFYFDVVNMICVDELPTTDAPATTTTEFVYPTIDPSTCDDLSVSWKGTKWSKLLYRSRTSVMLRVNVANNDLNTIDLNTEDYIGFLVFTRKQCGTDFVEALSNGKLTYQIYDFYAKYEVQSTFVRFDKQQTQAAIQFRYDIFVSKRFFSDSVDISEH